MFTGIIEGTGVVKKIIKETNGKRFVIDSGKLELNLKTGDSIAINGVCQTVENASEKEFTVFSVPETLKLTNLNNLIEKDIINLERPLAADGRFGGHIVQGHVENLCGVKDVEKHEGYWDIILQYQSEYIIPKGSVTLDGISLTIHEILENDRFRVQIIPETVKRTNISHWISGYDVNIETDYIVKAMDHIQNYRNKNR
ncbi:MAG: riboflavin synthase [Spirochaetia bacterium]|nr:riboflavin synthase [Spirochaetia bacterium]